MLLGLSCSVDVTAQVGVAAGPRYCVSTPATQSPWSGCSDPSTLGQGRIHISASVSARVYC